jgi:hypothetical protein
VADTPEDYPMARAGYDAHAMRAFQESLEQSRKALKDTDHMIGPYQVKPAHTDRLDELPKEPTERHPKRD